MSSLAGKKIAFIGLGEIGGPLASHLLADEAELTVLNRSKPKQAEWVSRNIGANTADSPAQAVSQADVVVTCVGNDEDLEAVYFASDGVFKSLPNGALIIDHTTASASIAKKIASAAYENEVGFIDAPVSGGTAGAVNRALSIMCGGRVDDFEQARTILDNYGKNVVHIGEAGAGQTCKMVNQICIAGVLEGLAEGIGLAAAAGLDVGKVIEAIKGGAAGSWQMNNRASYMVEKSYPAGFASRLMLKDLGLAKQSAGEANLDTPMLDSVTARYLQLVDRGLGGEDFTNIYRMVNKEVL